MRNFFFFLWQIHSEIYHWFGIQFDQFGRTSTPQQTYICQEIFQSLRDRDLLEEQEMQQLYCEPVGFLADRLVDGCTYMRVHTRKQSLMSKILYIYIYISGEGVVQERAPNAVMKTLGAINATVVEIYMSRQI